MRIEEYCSICYWITRDLCHCTSNVLFSLKESFNVIAIVYGKTCPCFKRVLWKMENVPVESITRKITYNADLLRSSAFPVLSRKPSAFPLYFENLPLLQRHPTSKNNGIWLPVPSTPQRLCAENIADMHTCLFEIFVFCKNLLWCFFSVGGRNYSVFCFSSTKSRAIFLVVNGRSSALIK